MFNFSHTWLLVALDVSMKSLFLAGVAAVLLRLFRIRSSSVRHRVWSGVLLGMLLLPILSRVVPAVPLPFAIDASWLESPDKDGVGDLVRADGSDPSSSVHPPLRVIEAEPGSDLRIELQPESLPSDPEPAYSGLEPGGEPVPALSIADAPVVAHPESVETSPVSDADLMPAEPATQMPQALQFLHGLSKAVLVIWIFGIALMVLRLMLGLRGAQLIVRRTCEVRDRVARALGDSTTRLPNAASAQILESSEISVPVTVGLLRPKVLLPLDWRDWSPGKLQAVLTHELTHVQRGDFVIALLAELNRCLYWFHPLSWWLRTQLSDLAEESCDDAAIGLTGDPTGYARHLLEVAGSISPGSGRVIQPGLSMASMARQSNVEGRIQAILDFTRPLSRRLTWRATLVIVALSVPVIAVAAALRPGGSAVIVATSAAVDADVTTDAVSERGQTASESATRTEAGNDTDHSLSDRIASESDRDNLGPDEFRLTGQVLDPSGRPFRGAKLYLTHRNRRVASPPREPFAESDSEGRFSVVVAAHECDFDSRVIAVADGFGFAYAMAAAFDETGEWLGTAPDFLRRSLAKALDGAKGTLHLTDDVFPISGTLRDTEGDLVAPTKIVLLSVSEGVDGLDAWEAAATQADAVYETVSRHVTQVLSGMAAQLAATKIETNADGTFRIQGIGRDRIVDLAILGPGIASHRVHIRTRPGEVIRFSNLKDPVPMYGDDKGHRTVFANQLTVIAGETQPVVGRITDRTTGQPIAGCEVRGSKIATDPISGFGRAGFIRSTTDLNGEYRLDGLPIGKAQFIIVPPQNSDYVRVWTQVEIAPNSEPVTRDVSLVTGVRVTGVALDVRTGKPVQGYVDAFAFRDNPLVKGKKRLRLPHLEKPWNPTDKKGRFEAVVVPGQSILGFRANNLRDYATGEGVAGITARKMDYGTVAFDTAPHSVIAANYNRLVEVSTQLGTAPQPIRIELDPGATVPIVVHDERGQAVNGFRVFGQKALTFNWLEFRGNTVLAEGLHESTSRDVLIWKPETNQAGSIRIEGPAPKEPQIVTLRPAGVIRGRIVDKEGNPREGIRIESFRFGVFRDSREDLAGNEQGTLVTDEDGRFEIRGLCPSVAYSARAVGPASMSEMWRSMAESGGPMVRYGVANIFKDVAVTPGESKDLGDIPCYPGRPEPSSVNTAINVPESSTKLTADQEQDVALLTPQTPHPAATADPVRIGGRVTDVSGAAIPDASVVLRKVFQRELYAEPSRSDLITELKTDFEGKFSSMQSSGQLPHPYGQKQWLMVSATAPGRGLAAKAVGNFRDASSLHFQLRKEVPIRGRILNLEGQPVGNARVRIVGFAQGDSDKVDAWIEQARKNGAMHPDAQMGLMTQWESSDQRAAQFPVESRVNVPIETFPTVQSDTQGRFRINGISRDQLLELEVTGPGIAKEIIAVIARPITAQDGTPETVSGINLRLHTEMVPFHGADFTYVSTPSSPIIGVVRDLDTKQPLAGAFVTVDSTAGSPMSREGWLSTVTDELGRYRIEGMPTAAESPRFPNRLKVTPRDQPYLPTSFRVPATAGPSELTLNMELRRVVFAEGRLFNKKTNDPVSGYLFYTPFNGNPHNVNYPQYSDNSRRVVTEDRTYRTDEDGRFRVPVIPGRGLLAARAIDGGFRKAYGSENMPEFANFTRTFDWPTADYVFANRVHALQEIDVPVDVERHEIDVPVDPGMSVELRFVDDSGELIQEPVLTNGLEAVPQGGGLVEGGRGRITGLQPGEKRTLYVRGGQGRLAALRTISADGSGRPITITVLPLVKVTGQLLQANGQPVADQELGAFSAEYHNTQMSKPTKTDADGRFEFQLPAGGPYEIRVRNSRPDAVEKKLILDRPQVDLGAITVALRGRR